MDSQNGMGVAFVFRGFVRHPLLHSVVVLPLVDFLHSLFSRPFEKSGEKQLVRRFGAGDSLRLFLSCGSLFLVSLVVSLAFCGAE